MSIFTEAQVRQAGRDAATRLRKRADSVLAEDQESKSFDVFLSHSIRDAEIVLGVKAILEGHGHSVYVDWIHDPQLDRTSVTKDSAARIRSRMKRCASLVYIHSENSPDSKWMPWELGYFDGLKGRVAIFPVAKVSKERFAGQEYLGLYPYVDQAATRNTKESKLWANRSSAEYATFDEYKKDPSSIRTH